MVHTLAGHRHTESQVTTTENVQKGATYLRLLCATVITGKFGELPLRFLYILHFYRNVAFGFRLDMSPSCWHPG